jgi:hypothetical protein
MCEQRKFIALVSYVKKISLKFLFVLSRRMKIQFNQELNLLHLEKPFFIESGLFNRLQFAAFLREYKHWV